MKSTRKNERKIHMEAYRTGKRTEENFEEDLAKYGDIIVYPYEKWIYNDYMQKMGYEIEYYFTPTDSDDPEKEMIEPRSLEELQMTYNSYIKHFILARKKREEQKKKRLRDFAGSAPSLEDCENYDRFLTQLEMITGSNRFSLDDFHGPIGKCNPEKRYLIIVYSNDDVVKATCTEKLLTPCEDQVQQCLSDGLDPATLSVSYTLLDKETAENARISLLIRAGAFSGKLPINHIYYVTSNNLNKYMDLAYGFSLRRTREFFDRHLEISVYKQANNFIFNKCDIAKAMFEDQHVTL